MKGKIAFVLGATVGYVLGTRAGRARYEQIKRGATAVWETPLVQQGVHSVKDAAGDGLDEVKQAAARVLKTVLDAAMQQRPKPERAAPSGGRDADASASAEDAGQADASAAHASSADDASASGASARGATAQKSSAAKKSSTAQQGSAAKKGAAGKKDSAGKKGTSE